MTVDVGVVGGMRVAGASVIGRAHVKDGRPRDDAFSLEAGGDHSRSWWFAAVSDGAGSRPLSRFGASSVTEAAAARAKSELRGGAGVENIMCGVFESARAAQRECAMERGVGLSELSCTLLCVACSIDSDGVRVAAFQVGDGLIAVMGPGGGMRALTPSDDQCPGYTLFIESVSDIAGRVRVEHFSECPQGLLVATDGVADDLIPWSENGPILAAELRCLSFGEKDAGLWIGNLLMYEKRGSFDDRTLVVAWRADAE